MQFKADVEDSGACRVVRLAGRLEREQLPEITRLYRDAPGAVRLDVADLLSADTGGLQALARLRSQGVELVGVSPYLALQLDMAQAADKEQKEDE